MRTLKKTLCLVLVLVMMAGLCSIGTSAAFVDADKINYTQAAEVLNALGVIKGDENGFRPLDTITRAEACVMIVRLLGAENIKATATSFTDLAGYGWAKDAIAYCEAEGIVAGNGDGTFNPGGKLTGYAFAKMLFCAAGYNDEAEGLVGANWEIGVAKLVKSEKIAQYISAFDGTAPCTREEAAELAFQAGTTVRTRTFKEGTKVEGGDFTVTLNGDYTSIGSPMIEEYLDVTKRNGTFTDGLNQPIDKYQSADGKVKFDVAKKPAATFTAAMAAKDVATALEGYSLKKTAGGTFAINNVTVAPAGGTACTGITVAATKTAAEALAAITGNGKLVNIYADEDKEVTDIVVTNFFAAKVSDVKTDKKTGAVEYKLDDITSANSDETVYDYADKTPDTIVFKAAPAKGDIVTVAMGLNSLAESTAYVYPTTTITGAQSATTTNPTTGVQTVTISGTKYVVSTAASTAAYANKSAEYTYYVDQYGFLVHNLAPAASTDYAYIQYVDTDAKTTFGKYSVEIKARAVLSDGTVGVYTVAQQKQANGEYRIKNIGTADLSGSTLNAQVGLISKGVFGYTVADGVITLEALKAEDGYTAKGQVVGGSVASATLTNAVTGTNGESKTVLYNNATKIVAYNETTNTVTVVTGTSKLPANYSAALKYVGKANDTYANSGSITASFLFTEVAIAAEAGKDLVYIDANKFVESLDAGKKLFTYTGTYANGDTIELVAKDTALTDSGLYNFDGTNVKDAYQVADESVLTLANADDKYLYDATLTVTSDVVKYTNGSEAYANITADTEIVYVNDKLDEVNGNGGYIVFEVVGGARTNNIEKIFITVD